jgi:activator of HSP90 ATPase
MEVETIHQSEYFTVSPGRFYKAFLNSDEHAIFTGAPASIDAVVGGSFSVFDGFATGQNVELEEGKKIVQSWRMEEIGWDENHYSIVTLVLYPRNGGTLLEFTHSNVPADKVDALAAGWVDYYWEPMKSYFASLN